MIKYFHELTEEEYKKIVESKKYKTMTEFEQDYPQPEWCQYPDAIFGVMGCWSLIGFMVENQDYCKHCDLNKEAEEE